MSVCGVRCFQETTLRSSRLIRNVFICQPMLDGEGGWGFGWMLVE
jgi:hypothetical protein